MYWSSATLLLGVATIAAIGGRLIDQSQDAHLTLAHRNHS
jgi:hypothetical protein